MRPCLPAACGAGEQVLILACGGGHLVAEGLGCGAFGAILRYRIVIESLVGKGFEARPVSVLDV
jgi:hypothetical protein